MLHLSIPVIVEGKYDKIKIKSIVDATVLTTDGFGVFRNEEKRALIRRLGKNGVILFADSDGGGRTIRSRLRGLLGGIPVYDLYIPQIAGKERRKAAPSKAGFLGVEGVPAEVLRGIFEKFAETHPELCGVDAEVSERTPLTNVHMFELGLTGHANSAELRDAVCKNLGLPAGMSAKNFVEAVNLISGYEEVGELIAKSE